MARNWSEAVKVCEAHPRKGMQSVGRWCRCKGKRWRYRMGEPDPVTGRTGPAKWSPRFPSQEAADADQAARRKAIADGTYTTDGGVTLSTWLDTWHKAGAASGWSANTIQGYASIIETWLRPTLGEHRLGRLTQHHVQAMLDQAAVEPAHRRPGEKAHKPVTPPTPGTLANVRACLRAALTAAMREGKVHRNVAQLVTLPTMTRVRRTPLTLGQLTAFRAAIERDPLAALWWTAMLTAMRRGELAGLTEAAVDEPNRVAYLPMQVTSPTGLHDCPTCLEQHRGRLLQRTKSRAGTRAIPLPDPLIGVLLAQRAHLAQQRTAWGATWSEHGLMFPHPGHGKARPGIPIRPGYLGVQFGRLLTASGIELPDRGGPTLHTLRTGFLTMLAETGISPDITAPVAGHTDGDVARQWYVRQSAEAARPAWDQVAERITGGT